MPADELTLSQALDEIGRTLSPVGASETVAPGDALGRVLAADVVATLDLPSFDNSAMDGYALRADDLRPGHWLHEIGQSYAGHGFSGRVEMGTTVRIMTGAPLPAGADTVVMREDVTIDGATVRVEKLPQHGANIRRRGEHIRAGDAVLRRGRALRAADVGLAAATGVARLAVCRRLRVGVVSTGDELADPPQSLHGAAAYDANRPFLLAGLRRVGYETHDLGICADAPQAFASIIARAQRLGADVLLASGGAAQGDADVVRAASGVRFVPLAIRPGRGLALARFEDAGQPLVLFGLPGNAVAAFVIFHLLVRPLLHRLAGGEACVPIHLPLRLAGSARVRAGRVDYRRARFVHDAEGALRVEPLRTQGSAMLRTVVDSDALVALGPRADYADGDLVDVVPLAMID